MFTETQHQIVIIYIQRTVNQIDDDANHFVKFKIHKLKNWSDLRFWRTCVSVCVCAACVATPTWLRFCDLQLPLRDAEKKNHNYTQSTLF